MNTAPAVESTAQHEGHGMSHPNRSKTNRTASSNPTPAEIRTAIEGAGLTQAEAGEQIYASRKSMENYVAEQGTEKRRMHPGLYELLLIKTGQMPLEFYEQLLAKAREQK